MEQPKTEAVNPRTVGVDRQWLAVLADLHKTVEDEKKGDFNMQAQVAKEFAAKIDSGDGDEGAASNSEILPEANNILNRWSS